MSYKSMTSIDEYGKSGNDNKLYGKIGKLIKIVDDLRDLGLNNVFELPKICVLGTQSAGKSSVLESIIGLDCLPRGSGLVTRRPLELRLCHIHYSENSESWAEFEELKGQKIYDFNLVKDKINELTDKVCGKKGGIVNDPIKLNIYSKTCPDLTVIDLPGITRIPLNGSDQPSNIEEITMDMCKSYCKEKTTIILCVLQANVDITTSEALHLARKLDPSGERTIGVLTKLDLMDHGTDAKKLLENNEVPLKNGYIALKNRSQKDLEDRLPVNVAIQKELLFFQSHPTYSKMKTEYFGIENLVDRLRRLFFDHLTNFLPGIYASLREKISESRKFLDKLGIDYGITDNNRSLQLNIINQIVNMFCENYEKIFNGKSLDIEENITSYTIKSAYNEFLIKLLNPPSERIHKSYIIDRLMKSEGDRISGFPESDVFHELLDQEYVIIQKEINEFYEKIYEIISNITQNTVDKYFIRFPPLQQKISEMVNEYIQEKFKKAKYLCNSIYEMNISYLYIDETGKFEETLKNILGIKEEVANEKDSKDRNNIKEKENTQNSNYRKSISKHSTKIITNPDEHYHEVSQFLNLVHGRLYQKIDRLLLYFNNKKS